MLEYRPQARQAEWHACRAYESGFGGAKFGGKSFALLFEALHQTSQTCALDGKDRSYRKLIDTRIGVNDAEHGELCKACVEGRQLSTDILENP